MTYIAIKHKTIWVEPTAPYSVSWEDWEALADLVGEVNFDCQFDCNGQCKIERSIGRTDSKCNNCCSKCACNAGYLSRVPAEAVETVMAEFDEKTGYWRPDGCRLPAKWRDKICLTFKCDSAGCRENEYYPKGSAWRDFQELFYCARYLDCGDTPLADRIVAVRERLRDEGLLKSEPLVQLVALV